MIIMAQHKYGIYQSSSRSCIFYKEDEDGNQSTFNLFVKPKKDEPEREEIFAFIDNEQMKIANWSPHDATDVKDVIEAFGGWAQDAPLMFEIEAHKSMSHCLNSVLKKEENE
jgi:hypothetical protein